ncbi:hypothetical protein ABPG74_005452 [Tetrahymena malaccensis]
MEADNSVKCNNSFDLNKIESLNAYLNKQNMYQIINQIGQGYFGIIFKAINKENQNEVALKIIENQGTKQVLQVIENEKRAFKLLQNQDNIIKCFKINEVELNQIQYIIFELELCQCDLLYLINQQKIIQKTFSEEFKYNILKSIIIALSNLQNMKIIHCDLKASNILIRNEQIILTDFGLSVLNNNTYSDFYCGQPTFCSPEKSSYFSYESDFFSLGIILLMVDNPIEFNYESNQKLDKYWLLLRKGVIPEELNLKTNSLYFQVSQKLISVCPQERRKVFEELKFIINLNKEEKLTLESYQNLSRQYSQLKDIQQSKKNDHLIQQNYINYLENDTFINDLKSVIKKQDIQNIFIDIKSNEKIKLSDFLNLKKQIIQCKITRLVINLHYQNLEDDFLQIIIDILNSLTFLKSFEFYNEGNTKFTSNQLNVFFSSLQKLEDLENLSIFLPQNLKICQNNFLLLCKTIQCLPKLQCLKIDFLYNQNGDDQFLINLGKAISTLQYINKIYISLTNNNNFTSSALKIFQTYLQQNQKNIERFIFSHNQTWIYSIDVIF